MNKRALIGLGVVPIVLAGVMFWTHRAAHERLEDSIRADIIADAKSQLQPTEKNDFPHLHMETARRLSRSFRRLERGADEAVSERC